MLDSFQIIFKEEKDEKKMSIKTPCKNCDERDVTCHTKCKKYIKYRQEVDRARQQKKETIERELYLTHAHRKYIEKRAKQI